MSTSKQNSKSKVLPAQCYGYAPLSSVNNFSVKGRDSLLGPMITEYVPRWLDSSRRRPKHGGLKQHYDLLCEVFLCWEFNL